MSTNRDFDRIAGAWLAEGPSELADRVLDAALDEVHLTHQRRRISVPWRYDRMSLPIRLAAAVVVGVLAVSVIYLNLPGRSDVGGQDPTPSPPATPTIQPTPTAKPTPLTIGSLALTDAACTVDLTVIPVRGGRLAIVVESRASTFSGVDLFKIRGGFTFADIEAHVDQENDRLARGETYVGFPAGATSITQLSIEPGESRLLQWDASAGTYAAICVRGIPVTGNPLAYYAVGPIEVAP
ncbi:MAG: hypothetical protein AB1736_03220 [Chloroflexota bacterium]